MEEPVNATAYRCPACLGTMSFDGSTGKLVCDFCNSTFTPEEVERFYAEKQAKADQRAAEEESRAHAHDHGHDHVPDAAEPIPAPSASSAAEGVRAPEAEPAAASSTTGAAAVGAPAAVGAGAHAETQKAAQPDDPIQAYLYRSKWDEEDEKNLRTYVCDSCAAELIVDRTTAVTSCPYCGNNTVLPGQLAGALKPQYVLPFEKTKEDAISALSAYYKGKRLLPRAFTAGNHIEEVQGVYVPFWLYSTHASGSGSYTAQNITTWTVGDSTYTKTDTYRAERSGSMDFVRVPVDGSTKMPDAHMDAIEPYDYDAIKPFSTAYLPGFLTERYDQDAKECQDRAEGRMKESVRDELRKTVTGYTTVDEGSCTSSVDWNEVSYALMPVWMLHTRYLEKDFLFAMNGQTGKLIGDLPVDKLRAALMFLIVFLIAAVVSGAIGYVLM